MNTQPGTPNHLATSPPSYLFQQLRNPFVEFSDGVSDLLLARGMRRQFELPLHLGARQATRLELASSFRVATFRGLSGFLFFFFALFHSLGEAGFRVDESFSGVTHSF